MKHVWDNRLLWILVLASFAILVFVSTQPIGFFTTQIIVGKSYVYTNGQRVATMDETGTLTYNHADYLGSTRLATSEQHEQAAKYDNAPFGSTITETGYSSALSPYKFTGKEQDDSGLYYYGARYYNPDIGRFTSVDPVYNPGESPYAYARNNPVKYVDPSGKLPINPVREYLNGLKLLDATKVRLENSPYHRLVDPNVPLIYNPNLEVGGINFGTRIEIKNLRHQTVAHEYVHSLTKDLDITNVRNEYHSSRISARVARYFDEDMNPNAQAASKGFKQFEEYYWTKSDWPEYYGEESYKRLYMGWMKNKKMNVLNSAPVKIGGKILLVGGIVAGCLSVSCDVAEGEWDKAALHASEMVPVAGPIISAMEMIDTATADMQPMGRYQSGTAPADVTTVVPPIPPLK